MAPHHRLKLWQNILLGIFCFPLLPFYLCVYCLCLKKDKKDVDEEHHQDIGHVEEAQCVQENKNIHLSFTNKGFKTDVEKNKEKKFIEIGHLEEAQCVQENQNIHLSFTNKGFKSDVEESKPKKHTEIASSYLIYTGKVLSKDIIRCLNIWLVTIGRKQDGKKEEVESQEDIGQVKDGQKSQNKHKKFSSSNKVHIEHDETVNTKRETQTDKPAFSYPWDKSNLKSLQIDLEAFKELDSYASKVKANGTLDLLVRDLLRDARTDLEKTRAIWIWICHHIEYDVAGLKNLSQVSTKAEDILRTRKGVCAGYSSLFQKMCSIAGVQCKKASGYSKGAGYKLGQTFSGDTDHAWNLVYLEKGWHLLDSTWGAGHADRNISKFTFKYDEYYFLTHPALFIEDHFPEQKKDQLLVPAVSLKQFEQKVRHTSQFYNLGLLSSQPDTAIIQTDKGKVSITIESHHPVEFIFHLNQTEEPGLLTLNKHGMKLNLYPRKTGEHILQIFARTLESEESYDFVLEYKVYCREVDSSINIPKCLCQPVGPSWLSEKAGLLRPSQLDPVIHTEDGCCKFSFALRPGLSLFSTLKSEQIQMTPKMTNRHIFQTHKEDMVDFMVRLPQSGTYVFCVHVKDKNNEDYITQCNYLITCKNSAVLWPEFPLVYVGWANHYKLVEPLDGVLPNNSIVPFKLHIPEVCGVSVRGKSSFPLTLNSDGYWEGTCNTENSKEIYVSVTYADQPNSYTYVLQYLVQERNI